MAATAFIGLGIMGGPMAGHLAAGGHTVRGYNRTPRYEDLEQAGGTGAESIAQAVDGAEVICLMLPDSPDVQEVLTGEDGVFAHAGQGALIIDFSTIRPDVAAEMAESAREQGFRMVDAPVSGGQGGAVDAVLSIMVGGEQEDFEAASEIFDLVGRTVVHVGPSGAGQTVKAANQLMVAANIQAMAEAVVFLEAYGVDLPSALDVLGGGLAGSTVLETK